jgi:hypothetical protein
MRINPDLGYAYIRDIFWVFFLNNLHTLR